MEQVVHFLCSNKLVFSLATILPLIKLVTIPLYWNYKYDSEKVEILVAENIDYKNDEFTKIFFRLLCVYALTYSMWKKHFLNLVKINWHVCFLVRFHCLNQRIFPEENHGRSGSECLDASNEEDWLKNITNIIREMEAYENTPESEMLTVRKRRTDHSPAHIKNKRLKTNQGKFR